MEIQDPLSNTLSERMIMIYWISWLFVVLNNVIMLNMSYRDALWQAFNLISLKTCYKQFKFAISNSLPDAICLKIRQSYTNWLNHDRKSLQCLDNVYRFLWDYCL